jgi:hypothetical protein
MQYSAERVRLQRFHDDVHVVRHCDKAIDYISVAVELIEALYNDLLDAPIPEKT